MQLICISRGSYNYGKEVASKLAGNLGYNCLSREEITDEAADQGIPVGKLEIQVLKNRPLSEEFALQIDIFKAFVSERICARALAESGVVYHGRSGHLALPGLDQVLRVRAIADVESRIQMAILHRHLSRNSARTYVDQVDDDIRRWVRILYNQDWVDPALYDLTINTARLSVENAASALIPMAQLPDFQSTPATLQVLNNRLLASRCRLAIARDDRTREVDVTVRVDRGNVSVTYLPRHAKQAQFIPSALARVDGIRSTVCTIATTNILYVAETFNPRTDQFNHLIEVAEKWNAAIQLVHLAGEAPGETSTSSGPPSTPPGYADPRPQPDGGILDDSDSDSSGVGTGDDPSGLSETLQHLIRVGRAGGCQTVHSDANRFAVGLTDKHHYSLIVIGEVFGSKGGAEKRLKRELVSSFSDNFRAPVLGSEDLHSEYLFGPRQAFTLLRHAALFALIYTLAFSFQEPIMRFVSAGHRAGDTFSLSRVTAALAVTAAVPFVANTVGGFYRNILKLVKLE